MSLTKNAKSILENLFGGRAKEITPHIDTKFTLVDIVQATTADATTDFDGIVKENDTIIEVGDNLADKTTAGQDDAINAAATVGNIYWIYRQF